MNTDKIYAEAIANEYSKKSTSKVVALKKLDRKAKVPALIFTYVLGIAAALLLGVGMCLCMGVLGDGGTVCMAVGVVAGVLGIAGACTDYPLYKRLLQSRRDKYAGDIVRMAAEIADESED